MYRNVAQLRPSASRFRKDRTGFARVMENLKSYENLQFYFPGLESHATEVRVIG